MKVLVLSLALAGLAGAAPALAQTTQRPAQAPDTGNMAYPTPVPQGNVGTSTVGRQVPDTGSMAYPAPVPQGNIGTTVVGPRTPDTGNMAYPAPVPQGNVGTTRVK
ncbi:MAG: hypothetical protein ACRYHQ_05910 [Janthinobacterium lividum]